MGVPNLHRGDLMSAVLIYRGQQLGRSDLNIFLVNNAGHPTNVYEISYAIYDFTTGYEVLVGSPSRKPQNPSVGEYFASLVIPLDANVGDYRIRWSVRQTENSALQTMVMQFTIQDRMISCPTLYSAQETDLLRRLRILLRDANPDRNYRFQPPTHEETVRQYNKVFGYIWEDMELLEFLVNSLNMIIAAPPRTPFQSLDDLMVNRREWSTILLTGAMTYAIGALELNWVAEEYQYTIGGVGLDIQKSVKYQAAKRDAQEQFDKQLEKAKATVKFIKGIQQPKYGIGIRSSFGPFSSRSQLTPRKFLSY